MHAIRQHAFGPPETLIHEEIADPVAGLTAALLADVDADDLETTLGVLREVTRPAESMRPLTADPLDEATVRP